MYLPRVNHIISTPTYSTLPNYMILIALSIVSMVAAVLYILYHPRKEIEALLPEYTRVFLVYCFYVSFSIGPCYLYRVILQVTEISASLVSSKFNYKFFYSQGCLALSGHIILFVNFRCYYSLLDYCLCSVLHCNSAHNGHKTMVARAARIFPQRQTSAETYTHLWKH